MMPYAVVPSFLKIPPNRMGQELIWTLTLERQYGCVSEGYRYIMDARIVIDGQVRWIGETKISQLVDAYPAAMQVLDHYGLDMCCGGGHSVSEASQLHGLDSGTVIKEVAEAICQSLS